GLASGGGATPCGLPINPLQLAARDLDRGRGRRCGQRARTCRARSNEVRVELEINSIFSIYTKVMNLLQSKIVETRGSNMTVIAMTREIGSLGADVAAGVAKELNLKIIYSEIVANQIAERMGVEESAVQRYVDGSASILERWLIDQRKLSRYTSEEI